MPWHWLDRVPRPGRSCAAAYPYHLALLQLEHDASFRDHSPFATQTDFVETGDRGFAKGAPEHHHLVFKAHPLEDGRAPLRREIRGPRAPIGVAERGCISCAAANSRGFSTMRGSAVTVNSTSAQQALWRGLPLKCFGAAVYAKPEFVSTQPIAEFFAQPSRPDSAAYRDFSTIFLQPRSFPAASTPRADAAAPCGRSSTGCLRRRTPTPPSPPKQRHQSNTLRVVR
jgi:capsular polysaccharide export protein